MSDSIEFTLQDDATTDKTPDANELADNNPGTFMPQRATQRRHTQQDKEHRKNPNLISHQSIDEAFNDNFVKPQAGTAYLIRLLLVASLVVLLPLIYLGITAAVGFATYYYAVHHTIPSPLSGQFHVMNTPNSGYLR